MSENAIVKADQFQIIQKDPAELREIVNANIDGDVSAFDLDRIKMPTSGGTKWTVPSLKGDESVDEITGIIVHQQSVRGYWPEAFSGDAPPQCSSEDGIQGRGDPGGLCRNCPFAQWGSDPKGGKGQGCKAMKRLFLARPGELLPLLVTAPPSSLKAVKQYLMKLTSAQVPYWGVISSIALVTDTNPQGIKYAKMVFRPPAAILKPEEAARIREYAESMRPLFSAVSISGDDYEVPPPEDQE